jgi:adenylate cyclase
MSFSIDKLFSWIRKGMAARNGRPMAMAILFGLCIISLLSEWPLSYKPAIVTTLEQWTTGTFQSGQSQLFDGYQRQSPRTPLSQPVTIVAIDESSLAEVGQWPWPRNHLAILIDQINVMKPLAIGLDIYMPEPDQTSPDKVANNLPPSALNLSRALKGLPSHETLLATSLARAPTILGAAGFDHEAHTTDSQLLTVPIQTQGADPFPFVKNFDHVLASLPQLQRAAHGQALLSVALEEGVVRRMPLVMSLGDQLVPSLPMEMLRLATQSPAIQVQANSGGVKSVGLEDLAVPTQKGGDVWLHFAKASSTSDRYVSALDILQGKADPERFEGKLILLGLTGSGLNDMRTTALGELVPGIEIQAQVIETIFDGRFLHRPSWLKWAETIFLLIFGLLLVWYVPRAESRLASLLRTMPEAAALIGLSLNMVIILLGFLFFKHFGLLVDASSIFIVSSATMGSLLGSAQVVIDNHNKELLRQEQLNKEREIYQAGFKDGRGDASQVGLGSLT